MCKNTYLNLIIKNRKDLKMKNRLKILILVILIIAVLSGIVFLTVNAVRSISVNKNAKNPEVTLDVEGYGQIKMELYPDYAPNTVSYFVKLIENGYYDGKVFFGTDKYVVGAGMEKNEEKPEEDKKNEGEEAVQAEASTEKEPAPVVEDEPRVSDIDKSVTPYVEPEETSDVEVAAPEDTDDYKISIEGEFVANGYDENTLRFEKGTLGFYRQDYSYGGADLSAESNNSATSLFFIETKNDSKLNGNYVAFGKVKKGMDIIEKMAKLEVSEDDSTSALNGTQAKYFKEFPVIKKATVDTFGVNYGMPKYVKAFDYNSYLTNLIMQQYNQ